MLQNLHIKNLALIQEIEVDFKPGLNILTGETGAGKSILLGSMQLALGGKMSKEMIRTNAEYAWIQLTFQVDNTQTDEALRAMDIYPEDGQVIVSRRIMEGRSVNKINGESCTIGQMKAAVSLLLDIHGQNEHQSLLYKEKQLEILDEYAQEEVAFQKKKTQECYRTYVDLKKKLNAGDKDESMRKREISFLEFEIEEIDHANLIPGEDEELELRYQKISNSKKIAEALSKAHQCTGYDGAYGAGELVGQGLREIASVSVYDSQIEQLESVLTDIDGLLNDFNRELSAYLEDLTFEEEEFHTIEQRLDLLNTLKAKYGRDLTAVLEYRDRQQEKLDELLDYENIQAKLQADFQKAEEDLRKASAKLSELRKTYSKKLCREIVESLQDLNFLDVQFDIVFHETAFTANGNDEVEYVISTNPGETMKPFHKVVSGGELSRIMLAIKTILADKDQIGTLIFDEIDTGISGRTAQKVSEKMAVIGHTHQVLCITHLPQIAAMADVHFEIRKHVEAGETVTSIYPLDEEASIQELARLLGGTQITDTVMSGAREMKDLARQQKNARVKN